MKIIAVSQRVETIPHREEIRDAVDQRLINFLLAAEFLPVPVPNCLGTDSDLFNLWSDTVGFQAVVLSGGNDPHACPKRDDTERRLLEYATSNTLPVWGICRGMQMMGIFSGTGLKEVAGHVGTRHSIKGIISGEVNSYHKMALASCPDSYSVLSLSEDGHIEAIRHESLPWEGWMWHPEREKTIKKQDLKSVKRILG